MSFRMEVVEGCKTLQSCLVHCCGSALGRAASSQVLSALALFQPGSWPCRLSHGWREGGPSAGACWGAPAGLPALDTQPVPGE